MVKLTFNFNQAEVKKAGLTEDELLAEVREFAKQNDIAETSFGVFEKDGEDALCLLMMLVDKVVMSNPEYLNYLNTLELNDNGEKEDCVETIKGWLERVKWE